MRLRSASHAIIAAVTCLAAWQVSACAVDTASEGEYTMGPAQMPTIDGAAHDAGTGPESGWPTPSGMGGQGAAGGGTGGAADMADAGGAGGTGGNANPPDASPAQPDTEPPPAPLDCSAIDAANPNWDVCETGPNRCAGVFSDGAGCAAFCGAAGLVCVASYGAAPGCQKETGALGCGWTGHDSDWCECAAPDGGAVDAGSCTSIPGNPQQQMEQDTGDAVFTQRHNWVVDCSPHAYTASSSEHESCDDVYSPDGSRRGTATFTFHNVPKGLYDVYVEGKHTKNRNPDGALFYVNGVPRIINQVSDPSDYVWDLHGRYCLEGQVEVVLDSTVNGGSDAVSGARLVPAY